MITQNLCNVFKLNVLKGLEDFDVGSASVYKIALYTQAADLTADTTVYTTTEEVIGTGYTAGGETLTKVSPTLSGTTAIVTFANVTWNPASFTTRGALIYNASTNAAVAVLNFGEDKTAATTFTVTFPTADANNAIIRIS
jgi:hypothetical protein